MLPRVPDEDVRLAIALENLANQVTWNAELWEECYKLAGQSKSELAAYVFDDLIHCSGRPLFRNAPRPDEFLQYVGEFRAVAFGLRSGLALSDLKAKGMLE